MKKVLPYVISIIFVLAVGMLSGLITGNSADIYNQTITKPPLSPPSVVFPIVWSILYTLMGVSAAMIYKSDADIEDKRSALGTFLLQLIFNFFWPVWFFNMKAYTFSFIWLVIIVILVIIMIYKFYKINKVAGLLQIPYLLWLLFAGYLNFAIILLNKK